MKTPALLAAAVLALSPLVASAAPQLGIEEAVKLAQAQIKERGLPVYIASIEYTAGKSSVWWVKWSGEIVLEGEKKESGLEISMDGTVARLVRGVGNRDPVTGKFDPKGRKGLENHRTRSDRPSILDLKH